MKRDGVLLTILAAIATVAFAQAYRTPVWILLTPCLVLPWWRIENAPTLLVRTLRSVAQFTCLAVIVLGMFLTVFPINPEFGPRRTTLALGYWITLQMTVFLLGMRLWPPALSLIPLVLALLVMACFKLGVNMMVPLSGAATCLFFYLVPSRTAGESAPSAAMRRTRWIRIGLHAILAIALTWAGARTLWITQDWVERTLYGVFSAFPPSTAGQFADTELGSLEELKLSSRAVMRVWSERPQKLRGRVFPYFDGKIWHSHETTKGMPDSPALGALPFASERNVSKLSDDEPLPVITKIITQSPGRLILAPGGALAVQANAALRMDAYQVLTWTDTVPDRYTIHHRRDGRVVRPGDEALPRWQDSGERMRDMCLRLPPKLDARVRELAEQIAAGSSSPDSRVRATLLYLSTGYSYTLKPGKFHTGDPLAEFLFEKKRGYCEYFATSAAILLRLQGIPTRYITGYSVQAANRKGDHYVIREKDGHAWIEVFLPGRGWIEADPTPPAEYEAMVADLGDTWLNRAWEWVQFTTQDLWSRLQAGDWRGLLPLAWEVLWRAATAAAFIFGIARLWRRWRRRAKIRSRSKQQTQTSAKIPLDPALAKLLAALDRRWIQNGFARPASRAPLEHARRLPPDPLASRVIDCFYRGCFAGAPVAEQEIKELLSVFDGVRIER